ncbi:hypothetical protein HK099_005028 [Clydaea vesicula]|uniref:Uncharacterized protein n=1 Tax=Clydaea vesicula TaxID=447962 RepID=A0AAD5U260_9FUNG|nr:hypothetical protein HK099_005028 [Clydaea vesicula]KAJ3395608.1 hypothetical protein HDU92_005430 [Lobulomyces angularis]
MKFTTILAALCTLTVCAPVADNTRLEKRNYGGQRFGGNRDTIIIQINDNNGFNQGRNEQQQQGNDGIDLTVLNFALTLEFLEATFYADGLNRFDENRFLQEGFAGVRDQVNLVSFHEATHVKFLQDTIRATFGENQDVPSCRFNFEESLRDVKSMLSTALVFEKVGVAAYDGAISLIQRDIFKTAGAAIATIEGRHAAALNIIARQLPVPNSFDTPLGLRSVVTLVAPFIAGCDFQLPAQPFQSALTLEQEFGRWGNNVALGFSGDIVEGQTLHCNFQVGISHFRTQIQLERRGNGLLAQCLVPNELKGNFEATVFVVDEDRDIGITEDDHVLAGPAFLPLTF